MYKRALVSVVLAFSLAGVAHADDAPVVLTPGHTARMLTGGLHSFAQRSRNIEDADVILYKTYAFEDDETGRDQIQKLIARAKAGAKVYVQFDVKGSSKSVVETADVLIGVRGAIPPHMQPLVDAGVIVIPTNAPTLMSPYLGRDHDKLLVTWKKGQPARAIAGGMNVGDAYAWGGRSVVKKPALAYRDTDMEVTGPEVDKIVSAYVDAAKTAKMPDTTELARVAAEVQQGNAEALAARTTPGYGVAYVRNDPKSGRNERKIEKAYAQLFDETPDGGNITISNAYFVPSRLVKAALLRAAARKVHIRVLLNPTTVADQGSSFALPALAFRDELRHLVNKIPADQLEVLEWHGDALRNEDSIHEKIAKAGNRVAVGSANLDAISGDDNSESLLITDHPRVGKQYDALMNRSIREGKLRRIDASVLRKDPLSVKVKGYLLNRVVGRIL